MPLLFLFLNNQATTFTSPFKSRRIAFISFILSVRYSQHFFGICIQLRDTASKRHIAFVTSDTSKNNLVYKKTYYTSRMEPDTETKLTVEELRLRRLAAFGILNPQNVSVVNQQSSFAVSTKKKEPENVIDLLHDSSSEENDDTSDIRKPRQSSAKKKEPTSKVISLDSDDDIDKSLIEDARRLTQKRKKSQNDEYNDLKSPSITVLETGSKSLPYVRALMAQDSVPRMSSSSQNDSSKTVQSTRYISSSLPSKRSSNLSSATTTSSENDGRSTWSFRVASWNVWFGRTGDGQPHPKPRMQALVRLLQQQSSNENPLLFIGLQEVIDPLASVLVPALESAGYHFFRQPGSSYGCAVAVNKRLEIVSHSWHPYSQTVMSRGFYQVRAKLPNAFHPNDCPEVVFTTTHLESWTGPSYTGAKQRIPQFQEMEHFCNREVSSASPSGSNIASVAIMTGDMNWDDERPKSSCIDPVMFTIMKASSLWQDAWLSKTTQNKTKADSAGYTYDAKINPMLGGNLRRRFDRCLIRTSGGGWTAQALDTVLIGKDAIPGLTWDKLNSYRQTYTEAPTAPSDHFGLVTHIKLSKSI